MFKKLLILFFFFCFINVNAHTKIPVDVTKMDITEISNVLKLKLISSEELVNVYLERINEFNKDYNAIISINENAVKEAQKLDEERKNGKVRSIIHGIPIIVKDNIDVKGMPTTAGAKVLEDNYPNKSAFAIKKLEEAGAIIIAKSNMSRFAFYASSSTSDYGTVKNAYNREYSSYGSSGGSATSIALNFAVAALGTDTNSSVRLPASAASLVGYRPSIGLVSRTGVLPYDSERDTIGTITKNVKDTLILMNIISGYDKNDNKSINKKTNFMLKSADLSTITIGIPKEFINGSNENILNENKEIAKEVKKLLDNVIKKLQEKKVNIVYIDEYYTTNIDNIVTNSYSGFLFCDKFNEYIKGTTSKIKSFQELSKNYGELDNYTKSCNTNRTLEEKNEYKKTYREYIESIIKKHDLDFIIYPSTKNKLLKVGDSSIINLSAHASSTINYPSITIPMGFDNDNLPYGLEIMGKTNKDNELLNIAYTIESLKIYEKQDFPISNLYEIPENIKLLINKYKKRINKNNKFFMNIWMNKVEKVIIEFKNNEQTKNYLNTTYYIFLVLDVAYKILIFILELITLIIFILLIRKQIKRYIKRHKK